MYRRMARLEGVGPDTRCYNNLARGRFQARTVKSKVSILVRCVRMSSPLDRAR